MPTMTTHTAIATVSKGVVGTIQVPTTDPGTEEILIKVEYAAMIPPDVYIVDRSFIIGDSYPFTLGFTVAGTVEKLGSSIQDLKLGDRVAAFTLGFQPPYRAVQQYSIQHRSTCTKIPDDLPLEAAATIPDNFVCAFYTVFNQLPLPKPATFPASAKPPLSDTPILIYGAGSTAGQYMIRLLHLAQYTRIFATASAKHHDYLRNLGATDLFDYNNPTLVDDIHKAAGGSGSKITLAVDCISAAQTMGILAKVLSPTGSVALLLPVKQGKTLNNSLEDKMILDFPLPEDMNPFPKETNLIGVRTFLYQQDQELKEKLMPVILPDLLQKGLIQPTRLRLMDQGTLQERVEQALDLFRNNKVSGEKVIIKIN